MDLPLNQDLLCKRWVHSRGEDSTTEAVYRPADYPDLRPARKIKGFEFKADGTYKRLETAPNDVPQVKEGTWQVDHAHPDEIHVEIDGQDELLKIKDLAPDRLTILKSS